MGLVCVTIGLVSSLSRHHIARYYSFPGSHTVFFGQQWPCPAHTAGARLGVLSRCATLWSGILQRIGFSFSAVCLQWQECMDMYYVLWAIVQYCFCAQLFPWWQWKLFHWFLCPRQGKRTFPQVLWQMPSLSGNDFHVFFMWIFSLFFFFKIAIFSIDTWKAIDNRVGHNVLLIPFFHLGEEKWLATCCKITPCLLLPKGSFYIISSAAPWWSECVASVALATVMSCGLKSWNKDTETVSWVL